MNQNRLLLDGVFLKELNNGINFTLLSHDIAFKESK